MRERLQPAKMVYHCDFCNRKNFQREAMVRHEKTCYYNPDRVCLICNDKKQWGDGIHEPIEYCGACQIAEEIKERL